MRRVIWALAARNDLRNIDEFLAERSPAAAVRTLEAIFEKARMLERFPAAGPMLGGRFRSLSVGHTPFSIVYLLKEEGVEILRIRHEREDWR